MSVDPQEIANLLDEYGDVINEARAPRQRPTMTPEAFVSALNGVIAGSPHGQQEAVLKKLSTLAKTNPAKLVEMLMSVEPVPGTNYLQDFFRSRGSNIMIIVAIASALFDELVVHQILDAISPVAVEEEDDEEDEDLEYNSEGDGYSH